MRLNSCPTNANQFPFGVISTMANDIAGRCVSYQYRLRPEAKWYGAKCVSEQKGDVSSRAPPGLTTRENSRMAARGSGTCSSTSEQSTTSNEASGTGIEEMSETMSIRLVSHLPVWRPLSSPAPWYWQT